MKSFEKQAQNRFTRRAHVRCVPLSFGAATSGKLVLFFALVTLLLTPVDAAVLPDGSELEIRLLHGIGTRISKVGDAVEAIVIAPLSVQGAVVIPNGAYVSGTVERKDSLGLGLRHTAARLDLHFTELRLPNGSISPIDAHVVWVETARESVRARGAVVGIHPTVSVSTGVSFVFALLFFGEPEFRIPVVAFKFLAARSPDAEILFPAGTELRLRLRQNLEITEVADRSTTGPAVPMLTSEEISEVKETLGSSLPQQQAFKDKHPSDLVNIVISGKPDAVERAFRAAGWHGAEPHGVMAFYHMYHCAVQRSGYTMGPMTGLTLNGRVQDLSYQKNLDTFSKRHHIRLWQDPKTGIWLGAATEDVGYRVDRMRLTHASDHRIDNERAKVVNDLAFTGCVAKGALIPRASLKSAHESGRPIVTDGGIAVLQLNSCEQPNGMPTDPQKPARVRAVRIAVAVGEDLLRSNPITIGYGMTKSMFEQSKIRANARMEATRTYIRPIAVASVEAKQPDRLFALGSE